MKWKDYPHLFANGKFKIELNSKSLNYLERVMKDRVCNFSANVLGWLKEDEELLKTAKLIARPIESMTDRELNRIHKWNYEHHFSPDLKEFREVLEVTANQGTMRMDNMICLLDLEVYPGPQSHFGDGTVIDAREVTV